MDNLQQIEAEREEVKNSWERGELTTEQTGPLLDALDTRESALTPALVVDDSGEVVDVVPIGWTEISADDEPTVKEFGDYAESVEYRNQREDYCDSLAGDWFYGDDATLTIYTGTFGNDHSPGASCYTSHDTYETREEYEATLARYEAMPEYLESDD